MADLSGEQEIVVHHFMQEYEAMCRKYGMVITACGCCDGVHLVETGTNSTELAENFEHLYKHVEFANGGYRNG